MDKLKAKIIDFLKKYYPFLIIAGILLAIYIPYLSNRYVLLGTIYRSEVWAFELGGHFGWIDFFKNMGEFVGGEYHYGFFSPIHMIFRWLNSFRDLFQVEYILCLIYASAAFLGTYYFFRKNSYAKWIALLGSTIFALNGQAFTVDIYTSEGFNNLLYMPLLFVLADDEFRGLWRKVAFGLLLWFEISNGTPQYVIWQIIIIGLYLLFCKGVKSLKPYLGALTIGFVAVLPQITLTQIVFSGYDIQRIVTAPYVLSWPGNPISFLPQLINPFSPFGQIGYLTPYYYTALIGTIIFFLFLPTICKEWRTLPKTVKFFTVMALFFLIASFRGNPIQKYFLGNIPIFNLIAARNSYRYVYFYFFGLSYIVAYCLQNFLVNKERLIRFSKKLLIIGIIGLGCYVISSIIYAFWGDKLYEIFKNQFISERLADVRGKYPPIYYFNLLKIYFENYFKKSTLLSAAGFWSAMPYLSFIVWGILIIKNKFKEPLKFLPHFIIVQIILTGLIFSNVLAQDSRLKTPAVFDKKENNISLTIKAEPDWRNSYIISYGNFAGQIYFQNLYKNSYDIEMWTSVNHYTNRTSYDSIPRIQNEINPFKIFRDRLLGTYIGYQLVDLYNLEGAFPDNKKSNPRLLNSVAFDKDFINPSKMEANLNDKIGILKNIGVRYIVSQYQFSGPKYKMIQEVKFNKESELVPGYTASLYLYQLNEPGKIVFAPKNVRLLPFGSIDTLDFKKIREIYDRLNFDDTSTIEVAASTALKEKPEFHQPTAASIVSAVKFDTDTITFDSDFRASGFVVINNYYYPGWLAFVDGQPVSVGRANIGFMAIPVPEGKHHVSVRFDIKQMVIKSLLGEKNSATEIVKP